MSKTGSVPWGSFAPSKGRNSHSSREAASSRAGFGIGTSTGSPFN